CPPGFLENDNDTVCLHFSNTVEPQGLVGASLRCGELNASLASFALIDNFTEATDLSYIADTVWWKKNGSGPEPSCVDPCKVDESLQCLAINTSDQMQAVACNRSDLYYVCMLPPVCPSGYSDYRGHCYKVIVGQYSFLSALTECNSEGAALAYPQTYDVFSHLAL
ncbi:putative complement factor H-like 4, partial [Homarus americanus]